MKLMLEQTDKIYTERLIMPRLDLLICIENAVDIIFSLVAFHEC